ncbi:hypothetical protein [Actinomadura sp. DC4]|uniref:hypothetical protein n=1 Tax=Actinomadura sp. DC4 TaxID=3055069 RepID=UPI0025AEEB62|nr:hypothetical protein [Actinomadura sp. DC4]MDN3354753.1 hypothetical protein [Actinomadura sp. DC4]
MTTCAADNLVTDLANALKRQGMATDIIEPSTKIKVFSPAGNAFMDELITLKPDADEVLTWYWSWDRPICPATHLGSAVELIKNVVSGTRA